MRAIAVLSATLLLLYVKQAKVSGETARRLPMVSVVPALATLSAVKRPPKDALTDVAMPLETVFANRGTPRRLVENARRVSPVRTKIRRMGSTTVVRALFAPWAL